jgi:hypothetical protein
MGAPFAGLQNTSARLLLCKQRAQARDARLLGSIAAGCAKAPEEKVAAREKPRPFCCQDLVEIAKRPAVTYRDPNRSFAALVTGVYRPTSVPSGSRN